MISKDDPLQNLYVDKDEVDRLRLFLSIKDYVGIDKDSGDPVFFENYYELDENKKIIIYMLYRRAASALGHLSDVGISMRDLSKKLRIDYDEVKDKLNNITSIERDKDKGKYYIPGDNLEEAIDELGYEDEVYYSTEEHTKKIQ